MIGRPHDPAIGDALSNLGTRLGVDRAWMFEYNDDLTRFRNTHEWCARNVSSHVEDLQDTPVSMIAWLHAALLEGRAVMINEVTTLPPAAKTLKREMLRQGDQSVLSVPVFHGGTLRACIGFDMVKAQRTWSSDEAAVLAGCGRLIATARYRDGRLMLLSMKKSAVRRWFILAIRGSIEASPFARSSGFAPSAMKHVSGLMMEQQHWIDVR